MKISETIKPINASRTVIGPQEITLTLDTETDELTLDTPAMFGDPVLTFRELKNTVEKLEQHRGRH